MTSSKFLLKNNHLQVEFKSNGTFELRDLNRRWLWKADPWNEGAGILSLYGLTQQSSTGGKMKMDQGDWNVEDLSKSPPIGTLKLSSADRILITGEGDFRKIIFSWRMGVELSVRLELQDRELLITMEDLSLPAKLMFHELHYPLRLGSVPAEEPGYLVVPNQCGILIPTKSYGRIGGEWWRMDDSFFISGRWGGRFPVFGHLSMNWVGIQHNNRGLMFILEDPFDAAVDILANTHQERTEKSSADKIVMKPRYSSCTPVWSAIDLKWGQPRRLRLTTVGTDGFVGMCKRYRGWAEDRGWVKTLRDKIDSNPDREKLIGSTHIDLYGGYPHYTKPPCPQLEFQFSDVSRLMKRIKKDCRVDRLSLTVWGCFARNPPECWPITPMRGGAKGWKKCCDEARRLGYLVSGYHAYSPNMENGNAFAPERSYKNAPWTKGFFTKPRWSRTCSSYFAEIARRNLTKEQKLCGPNSDFSDILAVTPGVECHDENHLHDGTLTRSRDYENKREIFEFIHEELQLPNATEHPSAYFVRDVDSFHGVMRHTLPEINIPVPLFQLCFHDCSLTRAHPGLTYRNKGLSQFSEQVLLDLSLGNAPLHSMQMWEYEGRKDDFKKIHAILGHTHKITGLSQLIDHEILDENYLIRSTRFEDGTQVLINLGLNPFRVGKILLPAYGYHVDGSDGKILKGRIECQIQAGK
jgi:hypothetical protein